jgi:L1 cell adhesion molecule like protein
MDSTGGGLGGYNKDGSVVELGNNAACGGILRDSNGCFLVAFSARLKHVLVLEAELWGIFYGLKLAWERDFHNIKIYSDSLVAIKLLKDHCFLTHPHRTFVENIHQVHEHSNSIEWVHVLREANQVADRMALMLILRF